jgi:hypothetical protein
MSEASAYATVCMAFLAQLLLQPGKPKALGGGSAVKWVLTAAMFALAYMSLSSGGYVGIGALVAVGLGLMAFDAATLKRGALIGVLVAGAVVCVAVALWIWQPAVFHKPYAMIDQLVFHKTASDSYIERSEWNRIAYQAFLSSYGLGAGMGSVRASSWIFALLSNIGLPGVLLLGGFMVQVMLAGGRTMRPDHSRLMLAAKLALIPNLVIASLSSTSVGYGLGPAWLLALAAAVAWPLKPAAATDAAPLYPQSYLAEPVARLP